MPTVMNSGSFNLLEPSAPVQACNGIVLPFLTQWDELRDITLHDPAATLDITRDYSDIQGYS
jgi:hypothetical protein